MKSGYGKLGIRDAQGKPKTMFAHRLVWELTYGPLLREEVVMHMCDNPGCINVEHLRLGSQGDNLADMRSKGRANPQCLPPDQRSNAKLSWDQVRYIRAATKSAKKLAKELGVSDVLVGKVRNCTSWKDLDT
jgi:hypothetical protein